MVEFLFSSSHRWHLEAVVGVGVVVEVHFMTLELLTMCLMMISRLVGLIFNDSIRSLFLLI